MRRVLGSVLLAVLLVAALGACGDDGPDQASDEPTAGTTSSAPATPSSPEPAEETPSEDAPAGGDALDFAVVDSITGTAAGGTVAPDGVPLPDEAAAQEFISQFTTDGLRKDVLQAVMTAEVPDGQVLYGAVVALGCDVPTDFQVTSASAGISVIAKEVADPKPECLAAMTTVVLVTVSADDVA